MKCPYQIKLIHKPEYTDGYIKHFAEDITEFCECVKSECPFFYTVENIHYGLYCSSCGKWLKWANKEEKRLCKHSNDNYNAHFGIPV